jgi:hypothetical protein
MALSSAKRNARLSERYDAIRQLIPLDRQIDLFAGMLGSASKEVVSLSLV